MLTRYEFKDDHGAGKLQLVVELNADHMPICFDTLFDWAMAYVEPRLHWVRWKLVSSEPVLRQEGE
jgi:hypothetical protein